MTHSSRPRALKPWALGAGLALALATTGCSEEQHAQALAVAGRALGDRPQEPEVVLTRNGLEAVRGELLVRFRESAPQMSTQVHALAGASVVHAYRSVPGLQLVALPEDTSLEEALEAYRRSPEVLYAEPNYLYRLDNTVPDDPSFGALWGLNNEGEAGSSDVDINAPEAWDLTTGSDEVVVAVIDSGINYRHEDLADNMWRNPGEVPGNGVDDDANGYVDDVYGINAINNTGDPLDDNQHGSHVAGTIAARGNNGRGVTGVAWRTRLIACKFATAAGSGATANAVRCLDYLHDLRTRTTHPVNLVATNNSWGGGAYSQALQEAIARHMSAGVLFIASAGNSSRDNDATPHYPGSYPIPNVVSVAASDRSDNLSVFPSGSSSNFGRRRVHIAAPGSDIYSTLLGQTYGSLSGTSMASPHVTGLVALLKAHQPSRDWRALKNLVLAGGRPAPTLAPVTLTGRRLRAWDTGGRGSLTCNNQRITTRWLPAADPSVVLLGTQVEVIALHINCAQPAGPLTASLSSGGSLTLLDDGQGPDRAAGDGLYSAFWQPTTAGLHTLTLPGGETFSVLALEAYRPAQAQSAPTEWRNITGTPLNLADGATVELATPFPIRLGGHTGFTRAWVSSEGFLSFTTNFTSNNNARLPTGLAQTVVAPYWDGLHTSPSALPAGHVLHEVLGTAPNREWVVEWRNIGHSSISEDVPYPSITFQAVFREGSSDVRFNYLDVNFQNGTGQYDRGRSATVGVQVTSADASLFLNNAARLENNQSLLFQTNVPPLLGTLAASPATLTEGQTVDFSSSFADAEGAGEGAWVVEWDFDYGGVQFDIDSSQPVAAQGPLAVSRAFAQSGRYTVAARVRDRDGVFSAVRTAVVEVGNVPPVANAPVPDTTTAREGQRVTLTSSFSDVASADSPWRVEWDFNYDGTTFHTDRIQSYSAQGPISLEHAFRQDGTYRVALRVVDRDNTPSEVREVQLSVEDVQPLLGAVVADASVLEGSPYTLRTSFSDPGDAAAPWRAEFDLDYDGSTFHVDRQVSSTAPGELSLTETFAQQGQRRLAVRLVDADGSVSPVVTAEVQVQDVSPRVVSATTLPASGLEPRTVELEVQAESGASPASVDPVRYYHWDFDGDGAVDLVGLSPKAVHRYLDNPQGGDTWQVRVWVEDEDSRTEHVLPVVVGNAPPVLAAVGPEHAAREGQPFRLQLAATDPAGAADPLTWELLEGPQGMSVGPTGLVQWVPALAQTSGTGREHTVRVRVSDDDGASASATFIVRATWRDENGDGIADSSVNRPPSAPLAVAPASGTRLVEPRPTLTVLNARDPEGHALGYVFEVRAGSVEGQVVAQGQVAEGEQGTRYTVESALAPGVYVWRARAVDAQGAEGPWSTAERFEVEGAEPAPPSGCSAAGSGPWALLPLLLVGLTARRRRRA